MTSKQTVLNREPLTLEYKPDFERARKYWDAFWVHEIIDRPCAVVRAKKRPDVSPAPATHAVEGDFREVFKRFERYLQEYVFLGECVPGFTPNFGPDQVAGFLGAPIEMSVENDTSWSRKIVDDWSKFLPLVINEANRCWQQMKKFHAAAAEYFRGKCLLFNIDMHSNIDALLGLRGAESLLYDMIDTPEIVLQAMADVRKLYQKIYNEFYKFGDKKRLGTNAWLHMYSSGRYNPIQADFICFLGPEMLRKFVLPALEEEAEFLDNSCFHLDGPDALKHLDDILAIERIGAIQWVPGAGAKPQLEWPSVLDRIQAAGKAIVLYCTAEQVKAIHGRYKPERLVYDVEAQSKAEGLELLEWLKNNT